MSQRQGPAGHAVGRHNRDVHLAQLNVARLRAPMDDPSIDDFRNNLTRLNGLAERSPGYVWRLQDESGDATSIKPFGDELEIMILTVWAPSWPWRGLHVSLRASWSSFVVGASTSRHQRPFLCLLWIPEGTIPTVDNAIARLAHCGPDGPSPWP